MLQALYLHFTHLYSSRLPCTIVFDRDALPARLAPQLLRHHARFLPSSDALQDQMSPEDLCVIREAHTFPYYPKLILHSTPFPYVCAQMCCVCVSVNQESYCEAYSGGECEPETRMLTQI